MQRFFRQFTTAIILFLGTPPAYGAVVDFEDISLSPESYFNGPTDNSVESPGGWGSTVANGTFQSGGVDFSNSHNLTFGSWSGFSVSNTTDTTTPGFTNQYSAYTGIGDNGSSNYGMAFGYRDLDSFDSNNISDLLSLPSLFLPDGFEIASAALTNATYAALSMLAGDGFAKEFGGDSGNDEDYFLLSIFGIDAEGQALETSVEFYLADYRFSDNSMDYIVDEWVDVDLSSLSNAASLHFNLTSSDVGDYGMNTPAYFAIDNIVLNESSPAVPEPSSLALVAVAVSMLAYRSRGRLKFTQKASQ